jgi:hypothetical protein
MTRAVECRTSLLKQVQNEDRALSGMEHARRIGENEVGQRRLDLLPLVLRELQPEIAGAVEDALPELDGRELTDLRIVE